MSKQSRGPKGTSIVIWDISGDTLPLAVRDKIVKYAEAAIKDFPNLAIQVVDE